MRKILFITVLIIANANLIFAQMPDNLSNTDKVYGLSKFWQEVNYNFIYFNKVDKNKWDEEYKNGTI